MPGMKYASRPLALGLAVALAWSPVAPAAPAFAQFAQTGAGAAPGGVRVAPVMPPTTVPQLGGPGSQLQLTGPALQGTMLLPSPVPGAAITPVQLQLGPSAITAGSATPGTAARNGLAAGSRFAPGTGVAPIGLGGIAAPLGGGRTFVPGSEGVLALPGATPSAAPSRATPSAAASLEEARTLLSPESNTPNSWGAFWTRSRGTGGERLAPDSPTRADEPLAGWRDSGLTKPDLSAPRTAQAEREPAPPSLVRMNGVAPFAASPWLYEASPFAAAAAVLAGTWAAAKLAAAGVGRLMRNAGEGARKAVQKTVSLGVWAGGAVLAGGVAGLDLPTVTAAISSTAKIPWVATALPYAGGVLTLVATGYAVKLARKVADKWAEKRHLPPALRLLARHAAGWATWGVGAIVATQVAGIEPLSVFKSLGITTLILSLSFKPFLGNLVQGFFLLLNHPFDIGDRVRYEKVEYTVHRMTLEELQLTKDGGATIKHVPYEELAKTPITIFKPYEAGRSFVTLDKEDLKRLKPAAPKFPGIARLLGLSAIGLGVALPGYFFVHPFLLQALPTLYALGVAAATFFAIRTFPPRIEKWVNSAGGDRNKGTLARLGSTTGLFLIGLSAAMRVLGVSWEVLGASAVGTGAIVTIAATSIIQSGIGYLKLLATHPFTLGDSVAVGDHKGKVVDVTSRYVVIKSDEPGEVYTFIPVTAFNGTYESPGDGPAASSQARPAGPP